MVNIEGLFKQIESTPVTMDFLRKRLPKDVLVVAYPHLKSKHRSELFKGRRAVVVLIPKKNTKTGHFVVLLPRKQHIEYFSSLGRSFESELQSLHEPVAIFRNLLGENYIYNRTVLQSGKYSINTCAAFVLTRCYLSKLKLPQFVNLFKRRLILSSPDELVSALVLLHFSNE